MKNTDAFLVLGIVFTIMGITGKNAFFAIGIAFLAVGLAARRRKTKN